MRIRQRQVSMHRILGCFLHQNREYDKRFRLMIRTDRYRQLAVVQGLVIDRTQKISRGTGVYRDRCCRVSFGVVCREEYDEIKHRGEKVTTDPLDKSRWAEDQVDWFIKQVGHLLEGVRISLKGD